MKSVLVLATVLVAVLPCAAFAQELSHNYVEFGVARQHQDLPSWVGHDENFDGGYLRASAAFGDSGLYGFGGYRQGTVAHDQYYSYDSSTAQLGLGYGYRIAPRVELIGEGSYLRDDFGGFVSEQWRGSAGVRGAMGDHVEGWAKAHYTDRAYGDSRFSAEVGGQYKLNDTWGVTGDVEVGDNTNVYTVGMRASF
ncbi:hypothetical protein [Lysobacter sp. HA18]